MPLDETSTDPMYLLGRLAALAEDGEDRLPMTLVDNLIRDPRAHLATLLKRVQRLEQRKGEVPEVRSAIVASIMAMMPPELPAGPVKMEHQGPYWIGYYHQRGYPRHVAIERRQLDEVGRALYGERWQTDLAQRLGFSDAARLRAILRGDRPLAGGALADLLAELRLRSAATADLADQLERLVDGSPDGMPPE